MKWKLSIVILQICYLKVVKPKVNQRVVTGNQWSTFRMGQKIWRGRGSGIVFQAEFWMHCLGRSKCIWTSNLKISER